MANVTNANTPPEYVPPPKKGGGNWAGTIAIIIFVLIVFSAGFNVAQFHPTSQDDNACRALCRGGIDSFNDPCQYGFGCRCNKNGTYKVMLCGSDI